MNESQTLGELKASGYQTRSVKDEMRANLIKKLQTGERLFPGVLGYEESVIPQLVNAVLSKHNLICSARADKRKAGLFGSSQNCSTRKFR
jgi:magnesium chelatase subunit I